MHDVETTIAVRNLPAYVLLRRFGTKIRVAHARFEGFLCDLHLRLNNLDQPLIRNITHCIRLVSLILARWNYLIVYFKTAVVCQCLLNFGSDDFTRFIFSLKPSELISHAI